MATETALELDADAAGYTGGEAIHFAGFPGVWAPDRPIALLELGFESEDEALARADELGLPLRQVSVDVGSAPMPERPNHLLGGDEHARLDAELDDAPVKRWTHAELDSLALEAGISEWPEGVRKVDDKVAFLDDVREGRVATDGTAIASDDGAGEV